MAFGVAAAATRLPTLTILAPAAMVINVAASYLWACLWVACYARGQPGSLDARPLWLGLEPGRKFSFPSACFFCKLKI